jgi:hypothetical protein
VSGVAHSTWNSIDFWEEMSRWVNKHGICIVSYLYMLGIFVVYTCTELIVLTAGLFSNYPRPPHPFYIGEHDDYDDIAE